MLRRMKTTLTIACLLGYMLVFLGIVPVWAAENTLIDLEFDDGSPDGFTTYIEGGDCELFNQDGKLAVHIRSCGNLDYANQAYWDGFSLQQGAEYRYSFDVSCDIERKMEYRLQLNGGDYHAYMGGFITIGPDTQHIEADFIMTEETDPAPRLAFNMGFMDDMTADPGEHTILFDHISLVQISGTAADGTGANGTGADGSAANNAGANSTASLSIAVSQIGYLCADTKTVILQIGETPADGFVLKNDAGETVWEGSLGEAFYDAASGRMLQRGDFSEVTEPGTYFVQAQLDGVSLESAPFVIGETVFDDLRTDVFRMLYLQRCGTAVEDDIFAHDACHLQQAFLYGTNQVKDVSGGWHDAGDYGRYVVSGAKAVADLMLAYDLSGGADDGYGLSGGADDGYGLSGGADDKYGLSDGEDDGYGLSGGTDDGYGIPESGNGVSDLLDEARFELEWMLKMQDENGGVYHKVTCRNFPGVVTPEEETAELVIAPISLTATADFAAVMAKASYLYRDIDPGFSQTVLSAALKAWKYGKDLPSDGGFVNPTDISTGEYPDTNDADEFFWAASELYLAGELDEEEVTARFDAQMEVGFGWQSMAGYGMWDLVRSEKAPAAIADQLKTKVLADVDAIVSSAKMDGFFMAFGENYPWGSNMSVANNGVKLSLAWKLTGEEEYRILAGQQRDYLLGVNTTGYCFVSQEGDLSPAHPHHRPSQAAGFPMKGMLAGGPNSSLEDPFAANVLSGSAPAACYVDNEQSYSTNEVAVYWNSPLITLLYGVI